MAAGSIREAARLDGHVVTLAGLHEGFVGSFEGLTNRSDAVVVGVIANCLSVDVKAQIYTVYQLTLQEVIKGDLTSPSTISVEFAGGFVQFPDGSWAEASVPEFRPPQKGDRLLLFLSSLADPSAHADAKFGLRTGVWGSFYLSPAGLVEPSYLTTTGVNVATQARGMKVEELLAKIRDLARKKANE